jgi:hypothetical protein
MIAIMAMAEISSIERTAFSRKVRRSVFGIGLHSWEQLMLLSLGVAGLIAIAVFLTTAAVVILQRHETAEAKRELDEYKLTVESKVADAKREGLEAGKAAGDALLRAAELEKQAGQLRRDAAEANERVAGLNVQAERLRADSLALQRAMLPRRFGVQRMNAPMSGLPPVNRPDLPDALGLFSTLYQVPKATVLIQAVPDFEAKNLALDIEDVLKFVGWKVEFIDEKRSHMPPLSIGDGVSVFSPGIQNDPPNGMPKPGVWHDAAMALSKALHAAGVSSVGRYSSGPSLFLNEPKNIGRIPYFEPPLEGILVLVGMKPMALELMHLRSESPSGDFRPDYIVF